LLHVYTHAHHTPHPFYFSPRVVYRVHLTTFPVPTTLYVFTHPVLRMLFVDDSCGWTFYGFGLALFVLRYLYLFVSWFRCCCCTFAPHPTTVVLYHFPLVVRCWFEPHNACHTYVPVGSRFLLGFPACLAPSRLTPARRACHTPPCCVPLVLPTCLRCLHAPPVHVGSRSVFTCFRRTVPAAVPLPHRVTCGWLCRARAVR